MKHNFKLPCMILATALAATLHAAVPLAWEARPNAPAPASFDRHHGETIDFRCTLTGFDAAFAPAADVRLWYQTNGMGQAWWSAPATVQSNVITATWSPAIDPGADRVSLFFGAPSNVYASAVLRLRHSPGFTPSVLTLPVQRLDFAAVETANAPYYTKSETESKIAELSPPTSLAPATNYTDSATNALDTALRNTIEDKRGSSDFSANVWSLMKPDGSILLLAIDKSLPMYWHTSDEKTRLVFESPDLWTLRDEVDGIDAESTAPHDAASLDFVDIEHPLQTYSLTRSSRIALDIDIPTPPDLTPYATKTELATVEGKADAAALDASSALRIVLGESVWFAVTNYMRTAEGVIPSLQLWEVRDSVTNLVYDSREEITNTVKALTRELHTELTNRIHDVEKTIPSKAWGNYQSDGTDNPEPGKVAIVNQPTVILTGGGTFNKYLEVGNSSVWVLKSSGLCSFGGDTNGNFFAVMDDEGKTHFKVSKTDSFDVDAICNGIFPRQSQNSVLLYVVSTNRQGQVYASPPVLSASTNLQETVWHEEVDGEVDPLGLSVSWERDDAISAWVATITPDTYPPALFLKAKVKQEGGVSVINTAPVRFDGGIQLGDGKYRLVPYTTGGKTYLTVEGLQ